MYTTYTAASDIEKNLDYWNEKNKFEDRLDNFPNQLLIYAWKVENSKN